MNTITITSSAENPAVNNGIKKYQWPSMSNKLNTEVKTNEQLPLFEDCSCRHHQSSVHEHPTLNE